MSLYVKIILIIFGLAYLISPVDIIPDLVLPYIGWIDDGFVIGTIIYLIRYGKLPGFLFKKQSRFQQAPGRKTTNSFSKKRPGQNSNTGQQKKTSGTNPTPYEILGIDPGASKKEIQKAYKESIKKYHPDKLSHLGKEFSDLANEKFLEIQKAYDTLTK